MQAKEHKCVLTGVNPSLFLPFFQEVLFPHSSSRLQLGKYAKYTGNVWKQHILRIFILPNFENNLLRRVQIHLAIDINFFPPK